MVVRLVVEVLDVVEVRVDVAVAVDEEVADALLEADELAVAVRV